MFFLENLSFDFRQILVIRLVIQLNVNHLGFKQLRYGNVYGSARLIKISFVQQRFLNGTLHACSPGISGPRKALRNLCIRQARVVYGRCCTHSRRHPWCGTQGRWSRSVRGASSCMGRGSCLGRGLRSVSKVPRFPFGRCSSWRGSSAFSRGDPRRRRCCDCSVGDGGGVRVGQVDQLRQVAQEVIVVVAVIRHWRHDHLLGDNQRRTELFQLLIRHQSDIWEMNSSCTSGSISVDDLACRRERPCQQRPSVMRGGVGQLARRPAVGGAGTALPSGCGGGAVRGICVIP